MSLPIISPRMKPFSLEESKEHYGELHKSIRVIYVSIPDIFHYFDPEYEIRFYHHIYPVHRCFRNSFEYMDKRDIRMDLSFMVIALIFSNEICRIEKTLPRSMHHLNILMKFVSGLIHMGMKYDDGYGKFHLSLEEYMRDEFPEYRRDQFEPILFHVSLCQDIRLFFLRDGISRPEMSPQPISESYGLDQVMRESPIPFAKNPLFDLEAMQDRIIRLREQISLSAAEYLNLHDEWEKNQIKIRRLLEIPK
jgi:hypothetical protein